MTTMRAYGGNVDTIRGSPVCQFQRFGVEAIKALTYKLATISASCRVVLDDAIGHSSPFGFSTRGCQAVSATTASIRYPRYLIMATRRVSFSIGARCCRGTLSG